MRKKKDMILRGEYKCLRPKQLKHDEMFSLIVILNNLLFVFFLLAGLILLSHSICTKLRKRLDPPAISSVLSLQKKFLLHFLQDNFS